MSFSSRGVTAAALLSLAWSASGCLITDPIIPLQDATNQAPVFRPGKPQPDPASPLTYAVGSTQDIHFDADARDPDGSSLTLDYKWVLDQSTTVLNGADASFWSTTPSNLGAGTHSLHVTIRDQGTPEGSLETEWTIVVQ